MLYPIPEDAKAYIIAEFKEDQSDSQTDYYGSTTVKTVLLGFSKHTRNLFSEMRKMADLYGPTQHLGTNKGEFKIYDNWTEENSSYPQSAVFRAEDSPAYFETEAEARAFAEKYAQIDRDDKAQLRDGEIKGFCPNFRGEYSIDGSIKTIENRQNYSMGGGYFLGHGRYSGWKIRKVDLSFSYSRTTAEELIQAGNHNLGAATSTTKTKKQTAPRSTATASGITVSENEEKDGVEIQFSDKPSEEVRSQLKANGFRWSRFSKVWYAKRNSETLAFAYSMVTPAVQEQDQDEEPVTHVQAELLALPAAPTAEEEAILDDPNASVEAYRKAADNSQVISLFGFSQAIHREKREKKATQPAVIEPKIEEPELPAYRVVTESPDLGLAEIQTPQQELAEKIAKLNITELPAEKITALLQVIG